MLLAKWILVSVGAILIISTLIVTCEFVRQYITIKKQPLQKTLFFPAVTLFILCILTLSSLLFQVASDRLLISQTLSGTFYGLQYYCLLLVLIIRSNYVFQETRFQLSNITKNTYKILFILSILLIVCIAPIQIFMHSSIILISHALMLLYAIALNVSLSSLFVYKLIQINKLEQQLNETDGKLVSIITKNTILTIISNFGTILVVLGMVLSILITNHHVYWVFSINIVVQYLDVYTNCICIALTFRCFIPFYNKLCGCVDANCKTICHKWFGNTTIVKMQTLENVDSLSSGSLDGKQIENITI